MEQNVVVIYGKDNMLDGSINYNRFREMRYVIVSDIFTTVTREMGGTNERDGDLTGMAHTLCRYAGYSDMTEVC